MKNKIRSHGEIIPLFLLFCEFPGKETESDVREVSGLRVRLDAQGHLRLRPKRPQKSGAYYVYIYRDASGVDWDQLNQEFYVRDTTESNPLEKFKRIAAAVQREYGEKLTLSTSYVDISSDALAEVT